MIDYVNVGMGSFSNEKQLNKTSIGIIFKLAVSMNEDNRVFIDSIKKLSEHFKRTPQTIKKHLSSLQHKDYLIPCGKLCYMVNPEIYNKVPNPDGDLDESDIIDLIEKYHQFKLIQEWEAIGEENK